MNQHENQPDHDYDDAELSSYYHAIPKKEPPAAIDKAIIKSARDSAKKGKQKVSVAFFRLVGALGDCCFCHTRSGFNSSVT